LTDVLANAQIGPDELFRSCDTDGSGSISAEELTNCILGIKGTLRLKEQAAIQKYFEYFDSDGSGTLSRAEF
jgi:hypothetical protein